MLCCGTRRRDFMQYRETALCVAGYNTNTLGHFQLGQVFWHQNAGTETLAQLWPQALTPVSWHTREMNVNIGHYSIAHIGWEVVPVLGVCCFSFAPMSNAPN